LQIFGQLVSSNFAPTMEFCTDNGDVPIVLCSFVQIRVWGDRVRRGPAAGGLRSTSMLLVAVVILRSG
jgi:hypothetical protein